MKIRGETEASALKLVRYGDPVAKARARVGRGHAYTPAKTASAEETWRALFLESGHGGFPKDAALCLFLDVFLRRAPRNKRKAPTGRSDLDNYCKLVMDSLEGLAYRNDSQIVQAIVRKRFAADADGPGGPRTELEIGPWR